MEGKNDTVFNFFDFFDFVVNLPRNGMRVNPCNPRTFAKLIGDKMMKKSVLVRLFAAAVMVIAGCEDSDSGGSGKEPAGPGGGAVTGVSLSTGKLVLGKGDSNSVTLKATVSPADAADTAVTWTSDKEEFATVDANGTVTGVKEGSATVTVTTKDGGNTATCARLPSFLPLLQTERRGRPPLPRFPTRRRAETTPTIPMSLKFI
jgi:hypothetical protein